jgi:hypothetical protein
VFVAGQSIEDPLATEIYLGAGADYGHPTVSKWSFRSTTPTGTKVMVIQDPDGHRFRIEAPVG